MTYLEFAIVQVIAQAARRDLKRELTMDERCDRFALDGSIHAIVEEIEAREATEIYHAAIAASDDPGEDVDDDR